MPIPAIPAIIAGGAALLRTAAPFVGRMLAGASKGAAKVAARNPITTIAADEIATGGDGYIRGAATKALNAVAGNDPDRKPGIIESGRSWTRFFQDVLNHGPASMLKNSFNSAGSGIGDTLKEYSAKFNNAVGIGNSFEGWGNLIPPVAAAIAGIGLLTGQINFSKLIVAAAVIGGAYLAYSQLSNTAEAAPSAPTARASAPAFELK